MKSINKKLILLFSSLTLTFFNCVVINPGTTISESDRLKEIKDNEPRPSNYGKFKLVEHFDKNSSLPIYTTYDFEYKKTLGDIIQCKDSSYIRFGFWGDCPSGSIKRSINKDTLIYNISIKFMCKHGLEAPPRTAYIKDRIDNFNVIKFISMDKILENGSYIEKPKFKYLWTNGYKPDEIIDTVQSIPIKKPQILWTKTLEGKCRQIQKTADHGFIISGISKSDALLIKTNEFGEIQWMKTYTNKKRSALSYVNQTYDGGYIASGYTYSIEFLGDADSDFWIIKTDSIGNTLWTKTIKGPYDDYANSILETMDSNFVFCGTSKPNISSGYDLCLIKLSSTGEKIWKRSYDNTHLDFGHFLSQYNHNLLIYGSTRNNTHPSLSDIWFIKTNSIGDTLYTKSFGGILSTGYRSLKYYGSRIGDISLSESEKYLNKQLLLGTSRRYSEDNSIWILNIDNSNDSISCIISKQPENDMISCIASTRDGGYLLSGSKGILYKTDLNGNFLWQMKFNDFNLSYINTIKTISKDEFILCGTTSTLRKENKIILIKIKLEGEGNIQKL